MIDSYLKTGKTRMANAMKQMTSSATIRTAGAKLSPTFRPLSARNRSSSNTESHCSRSAYASKSRDSVHSKCSSSVVWAMVWISYCRSEETVRDSMRVSVSQLNAHHTDRGLGFGVWGLGFGVWGLGFGRSEERR